MKITSAALNENTKETLQEEKDELKKFFFQGVVEREGKRLMLIEKCRLKKKQRNLDKKACTKESLVT